jgi:hypothetical protein
MSDTTLPRNGYWISQSPDGQRSFFALINGTPIPLHFPEQYADRPDGFYDTNMVRVRGDDTDADPGT